MKKITLLFLVGSIFTLLSCDDRTPPRDEESPYSEELDGELPPNVYSKTRSYPMQKPGEEDQFSTVDTSAGTDIAAAIIEKYAAALASDDPNAAVDCINPVPANKAYVQARMKFASSALSFLNQMKVKFGTDTGSGVDLSAIPSTNIIVLPDKAKTLSIEEKGNVAAMPAPYGEAMELRNDGGKWFVKLKGIPEDEQAKSNMEQMLTTGRKGIEDLKEKIGEAGADAESLMKEFTDILDLKIDAGTGTGTKGEAGAVGGGADEGVPTLPKN